MPLYPGVTRTKIDRARSGDAEAISLHRSKTDKPGAALTVVMHGGQQLFFAFSGFFGPILKRVDIAREIIGRSSFERSNYVQNTPVSLLASTRAGAPISADVCA